MTKSVFIAKIVAYTENCNKVYSGAIQCLALFSQGMATLKIDVQKKGLKNT